MADKTLDRLIALAIQGGTPTREDDPLLIALRGQQTPVTGDVPVPPATLIPGGPGLSEEEERNIRLAGVRPDVISGVGGVPVEAGEGELGEAADLGFDPGLRHQLPDPGDGKDVGAPAEGEPGAVGSALESGGTLGGRLTSEKLNELGLSQIATSIVPEGRFIGTAADLNPNLQGDLQALRTSGAAQVSAANEQLKAELVQNAELVEFQQRQDEELQTRREQFDLKQAQTEQAIQSQIDQFQEDIVEFRDNGATRFLTSGGLARQFGLAASAVFGELAGSGASLQIIENMINRDLQAQSQALGTQQNMLSFMQSRYKDSAVAFRQAQAAMRDDMAQRLQTRIAATSDPVLRAKGQKLIAGLAAKTSQANIAAGLEVKKSLQAEDNLAFARLQLLAKKRKGAGGLAGFKTKAPISVKERPFAVADFEGNVIGFALQKGQAPKINEEILAAADTAEAIGEIRTLMNEAGSLGLGEQVSNRLLDEKSQEIYAKHRLFVIKLGKSIFGSKISDDERKELMRAIPEQPKDFSLQTLENNQKILGDFLKAKVGSLRRRIGSNLRKDDDLGLGPLETRTGLAILPLLKEIDLMGQPIKFKKADTGEIKGLSKEVQRGARDERTRAAQDKGNTLAKGAVGGLLDLVAGRPDKRDFSAEANLAKGTVKDLKSGDLTRLSKGVRVVAELRAVASAPKVKSRFPDIDELEVLRRQRQLTNNFTLGGIVTQKANKRDRKRLEALEKRFDEHKPRALTPDSKAAQLTLRNIRNQMGISNVNDFDKRLVHLVRVANDRAGIPSSPKTISVEELERARFQADKTVREEEQIRQEQGRQDRLIRKERLRRRSQKLKKLKIDR